MSGGPDGDGEAGSAAAGGDFLVVGIGASAGGIGALKEFFARVAPDSGLAYVVILHLSPDHESQLAEVLQTTTRLPVTQVTGTVRVVPDHVYVIPQDRSLTISDGVLSLSRVAGYEERRAPVDIFLRTLADSHGPRAVGVILSGTGANGSMGLKRLKERGGLVIAHEPGEAEYEDMPRHAIATGLVDYVLPVAEMPGQIAAYAERLMRSHAPVISQGRETEADGPALREVLTHLRIRTGHDFSNYKRATLLRRVGRRVNVHGLPDLASYARFLREHPDEPPALLRDLLISVTNFFRDRAAFEALEQRVVPAIFEGKADGDFVRVWVAGCATGEEAYSIGMLLAERLAAAAAAPAVQIFASDLDGQAIAAAREGFYTLNDVADVPPERLRRFFFKDGEGYRVRTELREMVLFAHHNLIKDPPFSHIDLISCRNLLIYLNRAAQQRVMEVAHFALRPGGYLFLGTSETTDGASTLFVAADRDSHIYQRRAEAARLPLPVPESVPALGVEVRPGVRPAPGLPPARRVSYGDLHQRLLEQYAPPSVVVNEHYDVLHLSEGAGRYLQVAGGELTNNLLLMVRPELRLDLRTALYQAARERTNVAARGLRVRVDDRAETVNVLVRPVLGDDTARGFFLVLFERDAETGGDDDQPPAAAPEAASTVEQAARGLEAELVRVKSQLRVTVEQYETSAEELRASNEELQAMNEELRSAAEELETSKEELQSINEELTTVNQELKIKIEELSHANNDFINLINSTRIATVFLDRALRVKLFTPAASRIFNLLPVDTGRPLADITHSIAYGALAEDARRVVASLQPQEREVGTTDGRVFLMHMLPYRTTDDRIEGVVLTFLDITERKRAEEWVAAELEGTQTLHGLSTRSVSEEDFQVLYDEILAAAIALTRADAGTVQILDEGAQELVLLAARGFAPDMARHFGRVDARGTTPCGVALVTGERAFVDFDDPEADDTDGSLRMHREAGYLSAQSTPLVARTGKPIGMLSTHWAARHRPTARELRFLDLLARQAADSIVHWRVGEALRESQALLQKAFAAETVGVIFFRLDGQIQNANDAFLRMTGYGRAELIESVPLLSLTPPEFAEASERAVRELADCGETAPYEKQMVRKDGSRWWGLFAPTRIGGRGMQSECVEFVVDITESKRTQEALRLSEQRLRSIVEGVPDYAIIAQDTEGRVESWNSGAERMFGYTADEMMGRSVAIIFTPEDRAAGAHLEEMRTAREAGRAPDERWHVRKDGSRFFASGVLSPNGERTPTGYVKIARDLTSQKEAEDALRRAYDELEERVRGRTLELAEANVALQSEVRERADAEERVKNLLRQLVTIQEDERRRIARDLHDHLGQQMTALRLNLESLRETCEGPAREKLEQAQQIAARIDSDVDYLAWELRPAALDDLGVSTALSNFLTEFSAHFQIPARFHSRGLGRKRLAPEIETNLYRIAQEALNNVHKHARASGVEVLLELRDAQVALIVEDDGLGFDQVEAEAAREGEHGLGLVGMRERAAIVGGTVEIETAPGRGTTVFARVPARFAERPTSRGRKGGGKRE